MSTTNHSPVRCVTCEQAFPPDTKFPGYFALATESQIVFTITAATLWQRTLYRQNLNGSEPRTRPLKAELSKE